MQLRYVDSPVASTNYSTYINKPDSPDTPSPKCFGEGCTIMGGKIKKWLKSKKRKSKKRKSKKRKSKK